MDAQQIVLPTAFPSLNRFLTLQPGDLCVVASRQSVDRTAFALTLALEWAREFGQVLPSPQVVIFSPGSAATYITSMLCSNAGSVPGEAFRQRKPTDDEYARIPIKGG